MNELKIDVFADKVRNLSNAGIEYESKGLKYLYEVAAAAVFGEKRLSKSALFDNEDGKTMQYIRRKNIFLGVRTNV